ncbi:MAG: hypothetical protein IJ489_11190 [Clostridia bacterium]|nr:hypothetical protein [Clostridia bacterium]
MPTDMSADTSVSSESTAYPPASIPDISITESESTEQTEKEIFISVDLSASPYINDFEEFGLFPIDRNTSELYREKSKLKEGRLSSSGAMHFVVEGIEEVHNDTATVYRIRILETYGWNPEIDSEKIYLLGYRGTPAKPLLDRPPLEVGREYLRLSTIDPDIALIQMGMVLSISYTTAGKAYVYAYGFDFSELSCAISITDEKENQILKEGIHDKHIAYANANDIILPTFDYKCELNAFMKELGALKD